MDPGRGVLSHLLQHLVRQLLRLLHDMRRVGLLRLGRHWLLWDHERMVRNGCLHGAGGRTMLMLGMPLLMLSLHHWHLRLLSGLGRLSLLLQRLLLMLGLQV